MQKDGENECRIQDHRFLHLRNGLPQKHLQRFPGAPAQIDQQPPVIEKVTAEDLRDAEDKMPVRNLLEHIHAQPFPELHHALLMTGKPTSNNF